MDLTETTTGARTDVTGKQAANLQWLIDSYFTSPERTLRLVRGSILIRQDDVNDRLFLVKNGLLKGCFTIPDGSQLEIFKASKNMLVGIYSYFSQTFISRATVVAEEDTKVVYIDRDQEFVPDGRSSCLFEQFMPAVVTELFRRDERAVALAEERERTIRRLLYSQKMATLGQMAAGISHELNNSISVLKRNTNWLSDSLKEMLQEGDSDLNFLFLKGLEHGRKLSTREIRRRTKELRSSLSLSRNLAEDISRAGLSDDELKRLLPRLEKLHGRIRHYWEIGATLRDMLVASSQVTHVVKSIRDLGAPKSVREPGVDVNESIREAMSLLRSRLRKANVRIELDELPSITASKGELIRVWTNLMKNAVESMIQAEIADPQIAVISNAFNDTISVQIQDNGPGISPGLVPTIFQPDMTTKVGGLSFGLGLGLTICDRIISSYGGSITVKSAPGNTVFTISFPAGPDGSDNN